MICSAVYRSPDLRKGRTNVAEWPKADMPQAVIFALDLKRHQPRQQCCRIKLSDHCLHVAKAARERASEPAGTLLIWRSDSARLIGT